MTIFNISDDSTISNEKPHEINPYWDNNCYGQCIVCTDHGHDTTCEICYTRDRASNALRTSMASISIDDYLKSKHIDTTLTLIGINSSSPKALKTLN